MARLNNTNDTPEIVVIVSPEDDEEGGGRFKFLQCSSTVTHALLLRYNDDEGGEKIAVNPKFHARGWRLLRDLYAEERNLKGFKEFEDWYRANIGKRKTTEFPPEKLPLEVQYRRGLASRKKAGDTETSETSDPPARRGQGKAGG